MSVVQLPISMNLGDVKASCVADCKSSTQRLRSDNSTYRENDIVRIEIPCGRKGAWLHPQDSFLEFKFTPVFSAGTAGVISLDGNAFSIFKSIRILHGSNVLVNVQNCNRLYQALYDIQVTSAERNAGQITIGIQRENYNSPHCNLFGQVLTSGNTSQYSMTLPVSILGSLQEKSIPLGWMGASNLYLELEIENINRILTGRTDGDTVGGAVSVASTLPVLTSITLSEIFYNAKVSQLGYEYDNLLLKSLGDAIIIPATEYRGEQKSISSGSSTFSDKFSFNVSSAKMFLWWITNQDTANGVFATNFLNSAITQRQCGPCKGYNLTLNGEIFPSQPISMALNGATHVANKQYGAIAYGNLLRCFNQNSDTSAGGVMDFNIYTDNRTTIISDGETTKRFVGGIDLDRVDCNNSRSMAGMNTMSQNVMFNVDFETALSTSQNLYAFIQYDVAYVLQDGLLSVRM